MDSWVNPLGGRLLPVSVRVGYLAAMTAVAGFFGIAYAERLVLRALLSLGPWVFMEGVLRIKSRDEKAVGGWFWMVRSWAYLVKMVANSNRARNMTFGFQQCLPRLPVPSLKSTTAKWLKSVKPLFKNSGDEEKALALLDSFLKNEGPKLNRYLTARSFVTSNYVSPWWERYVFLSSRSPLVINSNYYVMDAIKHCPVKDQVFRAANLVHHLLGFEEMIANETLEPLLMNDIVPICMSQYRRLFGTCRVPGRDVDVIKHMHEASNYIVAVRRGRFYKIHTRRIDQGNRLLSPAELAHQFRLITEHANIDSASRGPNCDERDIMSLTSLPRLQWAETRDRFFHEGINRKALSTIEKASFIVHLASHHQEINVKSPSNSPTNNRFMATNSPFGNMTQEEQFVRQAHALFHGDGADLWFDKSFNLVVFEDARAGINAEHSHADAPVVAHMWEYALLNEMIDFENCRDASSSAGESLRGAPLPMPLRLDFEITDPLKQEIKNAKRDVRILIKDLDLDVFRFDSFGKDFVKHRGLPPDAFFQVAILLAFYNDNGGEFHLAYESCQTRLFREGRTETIRSVTEDAVKFVCAASTFSKPFGELAPMLRTACHTHQQLSRDCFVGRGIDRHLFALNVAAKGLEIKSDFLDYAHSAFKWTLSSAQQPQVQTNLRSLLPNQVVAEFFSPGGGFAPITDDGYGISYEVLSNCIFFHITSKKSSNITHSKRFAGHLRSSLELLRKIALEEKL